MAKRHNQWMNILQAVLTALASLFNTLKFNDDSKEESSENKL